MASGVVLDCLLHIKLYPLFGESLPDAPREPPPAALDGKRVEIGLFQAQQPLRRRHGFQKHAKAAPYVPGRVAVLLDVLVLALAVMLELVAWILARLEPLEHLPRGDEMVVGARGDLEDGVLQPGGVGALPEDVLLPDALLRHDVEGQQDGLVAARRLNARGRLHGLCGGGEDGDAPKHRDDATRLADMAGQVIHVH